MDIQTLAGDERAAIYRSRAKRLRGKAAIFSGKSRTRLLILAEEWERLARAAETKYPNLSDESPRPQA
jgi:hypothetical protein